MAGRERGGITEGEFDPLGEGHAGEIDRLVGDVHQFDKLGELALGIARVVVDLGDHQVVHGRRSAGVERGCVKSAPFAFVEIASMHRGGRVDRDRRVLVGTGGEERKVEHHVATGSPDIVNFHCDGVRPIDEQVVVDGDRVEYPFITV